MSALTAENVALRARLLSAESLATGGSSRKSSSAGASARAPPRVSTDGAAVDGAVVEEEEVMDEEERASVEAAEASLRVELHRQVQVRTDAFCHLAFVIRRLPYHAMLGHASSYSYSL